MIPKKEQGFHFDIGDLLSSSRALWMPLVAPSNAQATAQPWEKKSSFDEFIKQDYKDFMSKGKEKKPPEEADRVGRQSKKSDIVCKEAHAEIRKRDMKSKGLKRPVVLSSIQSKRTPIRASA